MRQPDVVARVHTKEIHARIGKKVSEWLRNTPEGQEKSRAFAALKPMHDPAVRAKVSARLREMNHRPAVQGGNGSGDTLPQRTLWELLGDGWFTEYPVSLGPRSAGYPTNYKLDIANPSMMIGIEVDGASHYSRKFVDNKKDQKLRSMGWTVLRFWNKEILASATDIAERVMALCEPHEGTAMLVPVTPCLVLSRTGQLCAELDLLDALRLSHALGPGHCVVRAADGAVLQVQVSVALGARWRWPNAAWCAPWAWRRSEE